MTKYIIVTGGVLSGLGKGVAAASIGHLLSQDYKVVPIKCDGYLNVDPRTMNPVEHGEVFVLDDGTEVDMDFGHYERFLGVTCNGRQNLTMGKVFDEIRKLEREGKFLGQTVQFIPHASNHIKKWWETVAKEEKADVVLVEIGGTIGDIENELYVEAARALFLDKGPREVLFAHLTYVPIPKGVNEQKSKPTQQSTAMLMQRGIKPEIILCRCEEYIEDKIKNKISTFCNVDAQAVISAVDVDSIYKIPVVFQEQKMLDILDKKLGLKAKPDLTKWKKLIENGRKNKLTIGICGKYTALEDSYASVVEALHHAGNQNDASIEIFWVDTEKITKENVSEKLKGVDGIIVPGGFGSRGIEGKIKVISYCRKNNLPYLGLCYGLQLAVVEFARNICGLKAHTTEIDKNIAEPVIDILPDKKNLKNLGGTLRLGAYPAIIKEGTKVFELYANNEVSERHRHRYEVNPKYHKLLEENGLVFSGLSPDGELVEFIELKEHPFFVATQAHPELKSSLLKPSPLFNGLIKAAIEKKLF